MPAKTDNETRTISTNVEMNPHTHTRVDVISFTPDVAKSWPLPTFQRVLRMNQKVRDRADSIARDGGVLPGILTFGLFNGRWWLVDGQHRREAFFLSRKPEGYADARYLEFSTMVEMAAEYKRLNSSLVKMSPDDILRGCEPSLEALQIIRKACPFVGYSAGRNPDRSPLLSMSKVIRCWAASKTDVPRNGGASVEALAQQQDRESATHLVGFLSAALEAWGRDVEFERLWGSLNLTICMWIYRRTVLSVASVKLAKMNLETFRQCLTALSADEKYMDWLVSRLMSDTNRAPAYARITTIMKARLIKANWKKTSFPAPDWTRGKKA